MRRDALSMLFSLVLWPRTNCRAVASEQGMTDESRAIFRVRGAFGGGGADLRATRNELGRPLEPLQRPRAASTTCDHFATTCPNTAPLTPESTPCMYLVTSRAGGAMYVC